MAGPGGLQLQVRHLLALAAWREPSVQVSEATMLSAAANLAEFLSEPELHTIWQRIEELDDPVLRLRLLGRIAPILSRLELVPDPLSVVKGAIESSPIDPAVCVDVLLDLAPYLGPPGQGAALPPYQHRVLAGVQAIEDPASRVRASGP
jgi:hypothetical protein